MELHLLLVEMIQLALASLLFSLNLFQCGSELLVLERQVLEVLIE